MAEETQRASPGGISPRAPLARGAPFTFTFNGRRIPAYEGDTLGSALHAAGERVLMRSIKFHRPRGLFCNVGACASCLVRVDGVPNVRACVTPATEGARVQTQNSFPDAEHDLLAVVDKVYRTELDVHDKFTRPRFLTPVFQAVVRRMAGFGRIPSVVGPPRRPPILRHRCDVLVIGGGAAGLGAAEEAARAGARVLLLEASGRLGGTLGDDTRAVAPDGATGPEVAARAQAVLSEARVLVDAAAIGAYRPEPKDEPVEAVHEAPGRFRGTVAALSPRGLVEVEPKALVVCTGSHENPALFPGNDLPGILGARGAQLLLRRHGVLPGRTPVILGDGDLADLLADQLAQAGVEPRRIPAGARVLHAEGGTQVEALVVDAGHGPERVPCDAVLLATGRTPRAELLQQADCALEHDEARGGIVPTLDEDRRATAAGVYAAGSVAGLKPPYAAYLEGRLAGAAAALDAGAGDRKALAERVRELRAHAKGVPAA